MAKIDELLLPNEVIIKTQERITAGSTPGMPMGDLYLTNKRFLFVHSKSLSVFSPFPPYLSPAGVLLGKDVVIPLQDIKSVSKNVLGYLKVKSDKEYQFLVSFVRTQD